jgi:hypothetical protein
LYYASVLLQRRGEVEEKWRDHEIRYAPRAARRIADDDILKYISSEAQTAIEIVNGIYRVLNSEACLLAFGDVGEPGNPERIEHLATRLIGIYEELLDWARNIRGTSVSANMRNTLDIVARITDHPIEEIRGFVDTYVAMAERLPARLRAGEHVRIQMPLTFTVDEAVMAEYRESLKTVKEILAAKYRARAT